MLGPPSISVSAMSPWEEDPEGLERSRFLLRWLDSGSEAGVGPAGVGTREEEAAGVGTREGEATGRSCETMLLEEDAPGIVCGCVGSVCLEGEAEEERRGLFCRRRSSDGLLGAEDVASAALRDMFIEIESERLQ